MTTELKGLAQPTLSSRNALRIGTIVHVRVADRVTPARAMLSALIKCKKKEGMFALLTPYTRFVSEENMRCEIKTHEGYVSLGTFISSEKILGDATGGFGFLAVQLNIHTPLLGDLSSSASQIVTTANFHSLVWGKQNFKVRRINAEAYLVRTQKHKRAGTLVRCNNKLGTVVGETFGVKIRDHNDVLDIPYCGRVARSRGRNFAEVESIGAPVVSRTGALSGIIVGRDLKDALVLPAEKIGEHGQVEFYTFGDDWPKLRVTSSN